MTRPSAPRGIEPRWHPGRGAWTFRVRWIDPSTGARRSEEFESVDDAQDFQAYLRLARRQGVLADLSRGRMTLDEFVGDEWMPRYAKAQLEDATLRSYRHTYLTHISPGLGHMELRGLSVPLVESFREDLEERGVGAPTVRRALAVLSSVCTYAIRKGEMTQHPVRMAKKPKAPRTLAIVCPSPAQVEMLRDAFTDPVSRALVSLLAYEGLRPEEALALDDRHIGRTTILVERKNVDGKLIAGQKRRVKPRTPTLFGPVRQDLAEYRLAVKRPAGCTLLFPRKDGQPWRLHDYRNWRRRVFRPAIGDLPITRPYDLRHACASLLLRDPEYALTEVAEHMGHTVATLSEHYAHVISDLKGQKRVPVEAQIKRARDGRLRKAG